MPLQSGSSRAAISANISAEEHAGRKHDQAVAIALRVAGKMRKRRKRTGRPTSVHEAVSQGVSANHA